MRNKNRMIEFYKANKSKSRIELGEAVMSTLALIAKFNEDRANGLYRIDGISIFTRLGKLRRNIYILQRLYMELDRNSIYCSVAS